MERAHFILDFWLGPEIERRQPKPEFQKRWWAKSDELDQEISEKFADDIEAAAEGKLDDWLGEPRGRLAQVILLDQFTRNVHRNDYMMYEYDSLARGLTLEGLQLKHDASLKAAEKQFLYMPLMHSEELVHQDRALELFKQLAADNDWMGPALDSAKVHRQIVERFGRFPHRNALMDRTSTGDEMVFLDKPGSSF